MQVAFRYMKHIFLTVICEICIIITYNLQKRKLTLRSIICGGRVLQHVI